MGCILHFYNVPSQNCQKSLKRKTMKKQIWHQEALYLIEIQLSIGLKF